jgi:PAS domain-containing protein
VTWSEETYRIQGLDPAREEASFERFLALIHPDDRVRVERTYRESVDMGRPTKRATASCWAMAASGTCMSGERPSTPDGQALRSVGMVADETELVEAQAERDRLVAVLENTSDIVSMADPQGRMFYFNRAGYRADGLATR